MPRGFVTFDDEVRDLEAATSEVRPRPPRTDILDTPVAPPSNFVTTEFVNRVAPQFTTTTEFDIHAHNPFHRVRVWIRTLSKDMPLLEEEFPCGTTDFKITFGGLFSCFNTVSQLEIVLFDKWDRKVRATLCYRDIHFPIVPHRGTKKKAFMCVGPPCEYYKMLNRQVISVEGTSVICEPDYVM